MLGKLIKYEFKAMGRVMLPLYAVMIFLAGLLSFNLKTGMNDSAQSLLQKFAIILAFLFFAAVMAVFVVMVIMVITSLVSGIFSAGPAAAAMMPEAGMECPYEGAKEMLLVDNVENKEFLKALLNAMYEELPAPKKRKK